MGPAPSDLPKLDEGGQTDSPLAVAYEQRTRQLRDARAALAEAVSALTDELTQRREEVRGLRQHEVALSAEIQKALDYSSHLQEELRRTSELVATLQNMKVVRWTARPRRIVYRLRARHR